VGGKMASRLQTGIYFDAKSHIGDAFGILFLRIVNHLPAVEVGEAIFRLWKMYQDLEKGIESDLRGIHPKHRHTGNLTVLIGYGSSLFRKIRGLKYSEPTDLKGPMFIPPKRSGAGPILRNSQLEYASSIRENHVLNEDIVIQFISESQMSTYRAIVETWKHLRNWQENSQEKEYLRFSRFYTGFKRPDRRGWLGFHDGLSNIKPDERTDAIVIDKSSISSSQDKWTIGSTYLAFMRILFDLDSWRKTDVRLQQIIIGRHKLTGCPLVGIDSNDNPIRDDSCPVAGTSEVWEKGNERYREHPQYGFQKNLSKNVSDHILTQSHIGRSHPVTGYHIRKRGSLRIFRQGFEFLEALDQPPYLRAGLNFVSFQNTTKKLIKLLSSPYSPAKTYLTSKFSEIPSLHHFQGVQSAGVFIVPAVNNRKSFPGSFLFFA
jgi:Dyp-type peroxidase family